MKRRIAAASLALLAGCAAGKENAMADAPRSPLHGAVLVGLAAVTDPARALAFYQGKLGMRLVGDDQYGIVLDLNGSMIRLQKLKEHRPQRFTVLGWNVRDIDATVAALASAGVVCQQYGFPFQDARGIATFPNGDKVAWFHDPDDNVLSVAQLVPGR